MKKRILAVVLAAVMCSAMIPAADVLGAGTGKAIQLVQNGSAPGIHGIRADNIYFGNYMQSDAESKEPVKWQVMDNRNGKLFVLSDMCLNAFQYHVEQTDVTWEGCTLRSWLNGYGAGANIAGKSYEDDNFFDTAFSDMEKDAIAVTDVVNSVNPIYGTSGGNNTKDKVFLLSFAEVENGDYGFTGDENDSVIRMGYPTEYAVENGVYCSYNRAVFWWLRSPGGDSKSAMDVDSYGGVRPGGIGVQTRDWAVRPVFNLDLKSVLFISAAEGGKESKGGIFEVEGYTGTDWKMTLLDSSRNFKASLKDTDGDEWTIEYSGARPGSNEYISAMISDSGKTVKYYGNVGSVSSAEGAVKINVGGKLGEGDTLYVFNEQVNGDYKTDYSSALKKVSESGYSKKGDVNADGNVDAKDKAILNRYLAGWEGYEAKILDRDAADINGDKNVDAKDKAILNRHLAGWKGYDEYFE